VQVSVSGRGEPATFAEEEEEAAYADEEEAKEPLERLNRPTSSSQFPVPKQQAAAMRLLGAARPDSAVVLSPPQPPSPVKRTRTSQLSAGESPPAAAPAASSSSSGATGARTRHASPPKLPRAETFEPYRFPEGVLPFRGVSVTVRSPPHQVCFDRRFWVGVELTQTFRHARPISLTFTEGYTHDTKVWALFVVVQGPFSVTACQTLLALAS
jgi:hypothetical protein